MPPLTVRVRGDDYTVHLARDGDHIVTKHNKRDPEHVFPVAAEERRAVDAAMADALTFGTGFYVQTADGARHVPLDRVLVPADEADAAMREDGR